MVSARFRPKRELQGYKGILHGGMTAALLDAAMTHCLFRRGVEAMTADLHVRFVQPIPCEALVDVRGWILSEAPPLYRVRAELLVGRRVMAWAEAKFLRRQSQPLVIRA
jgi:acyl-coenzyme A thioesterase PaaI-like protein